VTAYEPYKADASLPGLHTVDSLEAAVKDAAMLALLVGHSALRSINPSLLAQQTPARLAFDCTNSWQTEPWQAAGFRLVRLGAVNK
jgi:UDP-N-acetyl-D-mannosaminuronic acid dehydrogenase